MTTTDVKPRRPADDPRERLIVAATGLFCERGYHAVGTQEICERAGVLKGTFYHFFPSKIDLAIAVLDRFAEATCREFAEAAAGPGRPERRLLKIFSLDHGMVARQKRETGRVQGCLFGNFTLELAASEPRAAESVTRVAAAWADAIEPPIRELLGTRSRRTIADAARSVLALLQGSVLLAKAANDPAAVTRGGRSAVDYVTGLATRRVA